MDNVKATMRRPISDATRSSTIGLYEKVPSAWKPGYFPLWHRCYDNETRSAAQVVKIEPADGVVDYFTEEPVVDGKVVVEQHRYMVRLQAKPGDYTLTFTSRKGEEVTHHVSVIDPLGSAYSAPFRDGKPLWRRPGNHDEFIIKENPYRKLKIQGTVLDCGAHIGTFTRDALSRGAERVVSYEPEPMNFALLSRNTEHDDRVEIHHAAVSGETTDGMNLYMSWSSEGRGSGGNSLFRIQSQRPAVRVAVKSFQEMLQEVKPHAVKMDIKDAEYEIDWANLEWPSETAAFTIEADMKFVKETINPSMLQRGFRLVKMPEGWARMVTFWERY